jgi:ankyrin repeat protein
MLIKAGNSVNAGKTWRDEKGVTPLHLACEAGHEDTVKTLINLGICQTV